MYVCATQPSPVAHCIALMELMNRFVPFPASLWPLSRNDFSLCVCISPSLSLDSVSEVTPTMDLFVPATQRRLAAHIAEVIALLSCSLMKNGGHDHSFHLRCTILFLFLLLVAEGFFLFCYQPVVHPNDLSHTYVMAQAMVEAERNMRPASVGVNFGLLTNVTYNRRVSNP